MTDPMPFTRRTFLRQSGLLLATPLLMCIKLALSHLRLIGDWVEVFNGCPHEEANPNCKKLGFLAKFTKARMESDSTAGQ